MVRFRVGSNDIETIVRAVASIGVDGLGARLCTIVMICGASSYNKELAQLGI